MRCSPSSRSRAGFSLLEIIAVLLLIGILGAFTAPILARVLKGAVMGAVEQQTAEEAYWANSRLTTLLGLAVTASNPNTNTLTIGLYDSGTDTTNDTTILFNPGNGVITQGGVFLWGQVKSFNANYANHLFEIDIQLIDADHPLIDIDVFARNTL